VEKTIMNRVLNIGISRGGGLGDSLNVTAYTPAIRRKFPVSRITTVVCRSAEIFKGNPTVDSVIVQPPGELEAYAEKLFEATERGESEFDIFYLTHYAVKVAFSPKILKYDFIKEYKSELDRRFEDYRYIFNEFLRDIAAMDRMDRHFSDVFFGSANLSGSIDDMFINLDTDKKLKFNNSRYATLCNSAWGDLQTKCLPINKWEEIVKYLKQKGVTPVQVGLITDTSIPGTTRAIKYDNIFHTARIIKGAMFNIAIEGGIAHLAKAVKTDSIVLFGPTTVKTFGYDNNINIRSNVCSPCWWRRGDWMNYCTKIKCRVSYNNPPPCMKEISIHTIHRAIDDMIKRYDNRGKVDNISESSPEDPLYKAMESKLTGIFEAIAKKP
jgi:ADP-heptose:LPS heptosyltransferase